MTKKETKLKNRRNGLLEADMMRYWVFRWRNVHGEITACVGAFKNAVPESEVDMGPQPPKDYRLDIWAGFAFGNPKDMGLPREERARHSEEIARGRLFAPLRLSDERKQIPFVLIQQIFKNTPHDPDTVKSSEFTNIVRGMVLKFILRHGPSSFGIPWSSGAWDDRERDFITNLQNFQFQLLEDQRALGTIEPAVTPMSVGQC